MSVIFENRPLSPREREEADALYAKGAWLYDRPGPAIQEEDKKRINYETMEQVLAFGDKIIDGIPIAERLMFDNSSLWYYHKFRAYFRLRNLKYEAHALKEYAEQSKENIHYYTDDPLLSGMDFPENVSIYGPERKAKSKRNYFSLLNYSIIMLSRYLLNCLSGRKLKNRDHIILDVTKRQAFLDMDTLRKKKGNYVLGYMIDKAGKDFLIMDEAVQPKVTDGVRLKLNRDHLCGKGKRKNRYFGEPVLLNYFLSTTLKRQRKQLESKLKNELLFIRNTCNGEGRTLANIYLSYGGATRYYLSKYLAYKKFFSRNTFSTITSVDENSPAIRSILDAARINGMRTIGIQHGNIHDLHPAYLYTVNDRKRNAYPEHNLVWGGFWKEFLVEKGNYLEKQVAISGQIRTDIIPTLLNRPFEKKVVVPEMKNHDKLIVFASQPQRDPSLRRRAASDVIEAVKDVPGGFLLIKLHPNERYDKDYYSGIANGHGLDPERYRITLDLDLYLLISVCDMLITCFSTVGTETVYFNRPLIILDHLKQDIQNYHKEGVALQAGNKDELQKHIQGILEGNIKIDEIAFKKYVTRYAHAIDGKASERVLDFIKRFGEMSN